MLGARLLLTGDRHEVECLGDADPFNNYDLQRRIADAKAMRRVESRRRSQYGAAGEEAQLKLIGQKHGSAWNEALTVGLDNLVADVLATWQIAYDRIAGIKDVLWQVAS